MNDLQSLFTKEKCTSGMIAYLDQFKDGELPRLANEIKDNHFYVNALRNKFDADAANWVWNKKTANQKIDEMIVEYKIIAESNKIMSSQIRILQKRWLIGLKNATIFVSHIRCVRKNRRCN